MALKVKYMAVGIGVLTCIVYYLSLPNQLFTSPYSTVVEAENGVLLTATIATDGQWRFPPTNYVPDKFKKTIIVYEDKRFTSHPGIDILALARALRDNFREGKTVSGGSTLTMQVVRLSRKNKSRTLFQKIIEIILATRLELQYSKNEILNLYASHAPFGGNVVGIEAACWRYFGRSMQDLSWADAALLAVLPNAPSLIHIGKNRSLLKAKRNGLLDKLQANGTIDSLTCTLAKQEPIPEKPKPIPQHARHVLLRMMHDKNTQLRQQTSINYELQQKVEQLVQDHSKRLAGNQIHNTAALVLDVKTGNVLAYVGNVFSVTHEHDHNTHVDIISSPRSTGSILKPFLYAAALDEGIILPHTLLPDIPVFINGFSPENFSKQYDGVVPAGQALIRSLNVPAVYLLKEYRYEKFYSLLKNTGLTTLKNPADHYGLSLILGGAEGTLWDITGMYASMARVLNNYFERPGGYRYRRGDIHPPSYTPSYKDNSVTTPHLEPTSFISAASIYQTLETLTEVYRPGEETGWHYFESSKKIAWKTGTSYGFRDGWAVGLTPNHVVGVWVGNADGEGRPGLTGTDAAAPLLFSIFSQLSTSSWFGLPQPELHKIETCKISGHRASTHCTETKIEWVTEDGLTSPLCPYHQIVHLSANQKLRVNSKCYPVSEIKHVKWFVLPPIEEYYNKRKNLSYKVLPPVKTECGITASMDLIYPKKNAHIFIPRNIDGTLNKIVFKLAHNQPQATVFWHLDETYIGASKNHHEIECSIPKGRHVLTIFDDNGNSITCPFEILHSR